MYSVGDKVERNGTRGIIQRLSGNVATILLLNSDGSQRMAKLPNSARKVPAKAVTKDIRNWSKVG
jgi:hypothetical protein